MCPMPWSSNIQSVSVLSLMAAGPGTDLWYCIWLFIKCSLPRYPLSAIGTNSDIQHIEQILWYSNQCWSFLAYKAYFLKDTIFKIGINVLSNWFLKKAPFKNFFHCALPMAGGGRPSDCSLRISNHNVLHN